MFPLQSCQKFAHFPRKASLEDGIHFWEDIRAWKFSENRLHWSPRGSQFLSNCAAEKVLVSHSLSGRKAWACFSIDETIDLNNVGTLAMIRLLVVQASRLVFWISTPCTAGTQLRHVNLQRPEVLEKWRQQVSIHRRLWCSIGKVLSEFSPKKFLAVQEWPEHNSLWGESTYLRVAKKLGLERAFLVKRCCLDGIEKQWWLATNRRDFSEVSQHLLPVCSCTPVEHLRPTVTGFYSMEVVKYFWRLIQNYL